MTADRPVQARRAGAGAPPWARGLEPLLRECHRRLSAGTPVTVVRLGAGGRAEQDAVADLLGLVARPGAGSRIRLADVETAVRDITGQDLRAVLAELYGPIGDRAAQRADAAQARNTLWSWFRGHDTVRRQGLQEWAREVEAAGIRGTVDATRTLLERTLTVLGALPSTGEPLPVFAGRVLNDTHALDGSAGLAGLVLGAVAGRHGLARAGRAADRRALWHSVGIADDALSSTVLVAGLDTVGATAADRLIRLGRDDGRAVCLTLADVRDGAPTLRHPGRVWVVENPAVLALALGEFGAAVPPVVCVSGWPSTAATSLLRGLSKSGHTLWYHGDLDGEGVRIAAHMIDETGARPWRMATADYLRHVGDHGAAVGRVTAAPWDEHLAPAMHAHGVAVLEEVVWGDLRVDLRMDRHSA